MTYNPLFPNLETLMRKHSYRKGEGLLGDPRDITAVVHDKNEEIKSVINTVSYVSQSNVLASENDLPSVVSRVILSDQSEDGSSDKKRKSLSKEVERLRTTFPNDLIPEIGIFRIGPELVSEIVENWGDINGLENFVEHVKKSKRAVGKGVNIWLTSVLADTDMSFYDADDKKRSTRQSLAQLLGMQMGYRAVLGTFTRYHQNKNGEIERGGRVNAATGGLFDMLFNRNRLLCLLGYPLTGDQAFQKEVIRKTYVPRGFGFETSARIQHHSEVNGFTNDNFPLIADQDLLQVELGGNDDAPIAYGKSKEEVMNGIRKMTNDVAEGFLATVGIDYLRKVWPKPRDLILDFKERQISRMDKWAEASREDYESVLSITGGIEDVELLEMSYEIVASAAQKYYDNPLVDSEIGRMPYRRSLRENFLPSINSLVESNGQSVYDEMASSLKKFYQIIN
jgi:hypothetical protein